MIASCARLTLIVIWGCLSVVANAADELRFGTIEHIRTKTDARERMTSFDLYVSSRRVHYELRETPIGGLESTVKAIEFDREIDLTAAEMHSLVNRLVSAGIFKLPLSAEHRGEGEIWSVFGWLGGHTFELSYRRPPRAGVRKRVDGALKVIVHELGLDQISGPAYATLLRDNGAIVLQPTDLQDRPNPPAITVSEGDLTAPRNTTLAELIRDADQFDGKRVSVIGFYHSEFEGYELRAKKESDYKENLWCDTISAFSKNVAFSQDCWARVDGTFLKGSSGHFGMWPGEIARVTRFDVQKEPVLTER